MSSTAPVPTPATAVRLPQAVLVVVTDRDAVDHLPAVGALARRAGVRLLVGLSVPRLGFTIDAAVVLHAVHDSREELNRLEESVHGMLAGSGIDYEVVPIAFRDSRSPAKRDRRRTAAAARLARLHGATLLTDWSPGTSTGAATAPADQPSDAASTRRPAPVVAVLPDSADAVRVARAAARLALTTNRPLALIVPVATPAPGIPPDAAGQARIDQDSAAVAGRVQPALDRLGISALLVPAPYRANASFGATSRRMSEAVEMAARQLKAPDVVISAATPALAHLNLPHATVHRIPPVTYDTTHDEPGPIDTAEVPTRRHPRQGSSTALGPRVSSRSRS